MKEPKPSGAIVDMSGIVDPATEERERMDRVQRNRAELKERGVKGSLDEFIRLHNGENGILAGEDFLYMHRQMIKMVSLELAYHGCPISSKCTTGFRESAPAERQRRAV